MIDSVQLHVKGFVTLSLVDRISGVTVHELGIPNLVTHGMSLLLAQFALGESVAGITHFAVGSGVGTGTLSSPEAPTKNLGNLRNETSRAAVTSIVYDDLSGAMETTVVDGTKTNRLVVTGQISAALSPQEITEVALFGGTGAGTPGGGRLCNMVTFPYITKPDNLDLKFRWSLNFQA